MWGWEWVLKRTGCRQRQRVWNAKGMVRYDAPRGSVSSVHGSEVAGLHLPVEGTVQGLGIGPFRSHQIQIVQDSRYNVYANHAMCHAMQCYVTQYRKPLLGRSPSATLKCSMGTSKLFVDILSQATAPYLATQFSDKKILLPFH